MSQNIFYPVTQRFTLSESTINEIKSMTPEFGFNGLGEVVFRRTYSRDNESWNDVVIRVVKGTFSIRKEHYLRNSLEWRDEMWQEYARNFAVSLFKMEWMPPGRGLWMMGTDFCYNRGSISLYNCSATDTAEDLVLAAEWTMDCLMNGVGVGFSTNWRGTATMPNKNDTQLFVVPDSREGWVDSLIMLMCSYVESKRHGKGKFPIFDYSQIRPRGELIKGFGGLASGPEPLIKLHSRVEGFLDAFCVGYLSIESGEGEARKRVKKEYNHTRLVADIFNSIGACVVAGNVRRSAEIALGGVNDSTFINLKNYELNPERGEIGWMSNNSVVLTADHDYQDFTNISEFADCIRINGEPGMINLHNIQNYGRYGKASRDEATLVNPCGEISLEDKETCNLAEVFPPRCESPQVFYEALRFATFYASTVSLLPTHRPETNQVISRNRRIGVSISGIAQWANSQFVTVKGEAWGKMNYTRMTSFLRNAYKEVKNENVRLAISAGVPPSIRVTTIKPSGSISLLAGVTPGVHYPVSRYAIRRMRIGTNSPLVKYLQEANISSEMDKWSENTLVFSFAIDHGDVRPSTEVSPWEQFSIVAMLQRCYADNCVSATVYFDKEKDGPDVEKMLAMYIPILKSVSMLPHSGHGYEQAPYEPITKEQYEVLKSSYSMPKFASYSGNVPEGSKYCSGDTCEL
jgi:ribonucleoside-diphosphate reductase alpha chain